MRTPRNPAVAGRLGGVLFMVSGAVTLLSPFVPAHPDINRLGVFLVGVAAVAGGALIWAIPWGRLPARAQWILMLLAHGLIALHNQFGGNDPFRYGLFFLVSFAWVGMTQRRFTSLVFQPSFLTAYLTPLLVGHAPAWEISSVLYAAPVCILVAEALSWTGDRLEASQNEVLRREERFRSLVQNSMDVVAVVDAEGRITYISPSVEAVLGWRPDEVIGRPAQPRRLPGAPGAGGGPGPAARDVPGRAFHRPRRVQGGERLVRARRGLPPAARRGRAPAQLHPSRGHAGPPGRRRVHRSHRGPGPTRPGRGGGPAPARPHRLALPPRWPPGGAGLQHRHRPGSPWRRGARRAAAAGGRCHVP